MFDKLLQFSASQAVLATAVGDGIAQVEAGDAYKGLFFEVQIPEAYSGGTSVKIQLMTAATKDEIDAGTGTVLIDSGAIAVADLTLNARPIVQRVPFGMKKYLGVYYTVVGSPTAGKISAHLRADVPLNQS